MKVIDLLNKIANGEELPEIIKVKGGIYYLCEGDQSGCYYFTERQGFGGVSLGFDTSAMNEEVEIIEEDKKIEKIPYQFNLNYIDSKLDTYTKEEINKTINDIYNKINEIIDKLNKED